MACCVFIAGIIALLGVARKRFLGQASTKSDEALAWRMKGTANG